MAPAQADDRSAAAYYEQVPAGVVPALRALVRRRGTTMFSLVAAAFAAALSRDNASAEVTIGTVMAGRERAECKNVVGLFANTVVLRLGLAGNPTLEELLDRVHGKVMEAQAHQYCPFDKVVEALNPARGGTVLWHVEENSD